LTIFFLYPFFYPEKRLFNGINILDDKAEIM